MPSPSQKSRHFLWISLIITTILLPRQCRGLPYLSITSEIPKCVSVELAMYSQMKVHYLIPDMAMYPKDLNVRSETEYERYLKELEEKGEEDKWDHSENAKEKAKASVQDQINAAFDDLQNTISKKPSKTQSAATPPEEPVDSALDESSEWKEHQLPVLSITDGLHSRTKRDVPPGYPEHLDDDDYTAHVSRSRQSTHKLRDVRGAVDHTTESHGHVEICVRVPLATTTRPFRVHLSLNEVFAEEDRRQTKEEELQDQITRHVYAMEADVMYLKRTIDGVLNMADMAKESELAFHKHTVIMHQGAWRIPFLRVVVLVLTGIIQSLSVGKFLKRRIFGY